ncbi:hypothetical protein F5876DRAFT_83159 [Lentinula aff. lateritia]|uniref:Uncharacterized protein n=1 Tax=Lentinula aff. lateritia TaxID=2804960 RepID=A0ACC1TIB4_9AGAR|nr:hypothetical protein F5876DRAFT_83159 [Lentinula aff. lateritia]
MDNITLLQLWKGTSALFLSSGILSLFEMTKDHSELQLLGEHLNKSMHDFEIKTILTDALIHSTPVVHISPEQWTVIVYFLSYYQLLHMMKDDNRTMVALCTNTYPLGALPSTLSQWYGSLGTTDGWPGVLKSAQRSLKKAQKHELSGTHGPEDPLTRSLMVTFRLMRQQKADKICLNTSLVVLGIIFAQNGIYLLPHSFKEFIALVKNCVQRSHPEHCFDDSQLLEYQGEYIGNNMFFPLQVFCLITPLFILRSCNEGTGKHPEYLVEIEMQWINKILTVVKGEKTVEEVLLEFSQENLSLDNISTKDATYFKVSDNFCNSLSSAINQVNEPSDAGGIQPPLIPVIGDEGQIAGHKRTRDGPEYANENTSIIADTEHPSKSQCTDGNQCSSGTSSARTPEHGLNISQEQMHPSTPADNQTDESMTPASDKEEEDGLIIEGGGPASQGPESPSPDDVEDELMTPASDEEEEDGLAIEGGGLASQGPESPSPDNVEDELMTPASDKEKEDGLVIQHGGSGSQGHTTPSQESPSEAEVEDLISHRGNRFPSPISASLLKLVGETNTWSPDLSSSHEKLWINEDMFMDKIQSPTGKKGLHADEHDLKHKSTLEDVEAIISKVHQTASADGCEIRPGACSKPFPIFEVEYSNFNSSLLFPEARKQRIFHNQHILIHNAPCPDSSELKFDPLTFSEHLGSVSELRTLHDATLLEESELKKDANKVYSSGMLSDVILATQNPRGKILNSVSRVLLIASPTSHSQCALQANTQLQSSELSRAISGPYLTSEPL